MQEKKLNNVKNARGELTHTRKYKQQKCKKKIGKCKNIQNAIRNARRELRTYKKNYKIINNCKNICKMEEKYKTLVKMQEGS